MDFELLAEARLVDLDREVDALCVCARLLREWRRSMETLAIDDDGSGVRPEQGSDSPPEFGVGAAWIPGPGFVARRRAWLHRLIATQKARGAAAGDVT